MSSVSIGRHGAEGAGLEGRGRGRCVNGEREREGKEHRSVIEGKLFPFPLPERGVNRSPSSRGQNTMERKQIE